MTGAQTRHRGARPRTLGRAFTLVEMLVVLAIIATLAGLILPAISAAREESRRAKCLSNLGQIGKALSIYCNNNEDYLPSWSGYGLAESEVSMFGDTLVNYAGHQGVSRHMVVAYGAADPDPATNLMPFDPVAPGEDPDPHLNFMAVGLGLLIAREDLNDPQVLDCPSMRGTAKTYYGIDSDQTYEYTTQVWKLLGGQLGKRFLNGDGRKLRHTDIDGTDSVTAILSSYSYRCTPFYCRRTPDNNADHPWTSEPTWIDGTDDDFSARRIGGRWVAQWELNHTKPVVTAEFMTPPFKTRRKLGQRAIASDSFDYGSPGDTPFKRKGGVVNRHHGNGYNVLFIEGNAEWYDDSGGQIKDWTDWPDPSAASSPAPFYGFENLTISSPTSQEVWNIFDRMVGTDVD